MEFKFLRDILSEKSQLSCTRLMSIIALLISGYVAVVGLQRGTDLSGLAMLCGTFLTAAFGGKVWQKSIEVKSQQGQTTQISQDSQIPKQQPPHS